MKKWKIATIFGLCTSSLTGLGFSTFIITQENSDYIFNVQVNVDEVVDIQNLATITEITSLTYCDNGYLPKTGNQYNRHGHIVIGLDIKENDSIDYVSTFPVLNFSLTYSTKNQNLVENGNLFFNHFISNVLIYYSYPDSALGEVNYGGLSDLFYSNGIYSSTYDVSFTLSSYSSHIDVDFVFANFNEAYPFLTDGEFNFSVRGDVK